MSVLWPVLVALNLISEVLASAEWRWIAPTATILVALTHTNALRASRADRLIGFAIVIAGVITGSPSTVSAGTLLGLGVSHFALPMLASLGLLFLHRVWLVGFDFGAALAAAVGVLNPVLNPIVRAEREGLVRHDVLVTWSTLSWLPVLAVVLTWKSLRRGPAVARYVATILLAITGQAATLLILADRIHIHDYAGWIVHLTATFWALVASWAVLGRGTQMPSSVSVTRWAGGCAVLALCLIALAPDRNNRPVRVAFDEAHGQWETAQGEFTTANYGRDTVYNYGALAQWLSRKHRVDFRRSVDAPIESDVLVVKTPTAAFGREEKSLIRDFISAGGTLITVGDHTNLFGTTLVLNDLLRDYGMQLREDAVIPWAGGHYQLQRRWWNPRWPLEHIPTLQLQTAASIQSQHPAVFPLLVTEAVVGEKAEYSNERFFGDLHPGLEDRQGPLVVAAIRPFGEGRVLTFADSTIWSNFSFTFSGNRELFQNFLEYGTSSVSGHWVRVALGAVGVVVIGIAAARGAGNIVLLVLASVAVVGVLTSAAPAGERLELYPGRWIAVDAQHSTADYHADPKSGSTHDLRDYSTFLAWAGRRGVLSVSEGAAFSNPSRPALILNPQSPFSERELDDVEQYVRRGGRLLVLDDPLYSAQSTAEPLLHRFGFSVRLTPAMTAIHQAAGMALPSSLLGLALTVLQAERRQQGDAVASDVGMIPALVGGDALLTDHRGIVIARRLKLGAGEVTVFYSSAVFSEASMGDVWGSPDVAPQKRQLYQVAYDLLDSLF